MADSSSYIHMVHHLIEECLIFNMSKEECMEALYKHANIMPAITSTVWSELEKENKDFFEGYYNTRRDAQTQSISSSSC
ncbi:putative angiotensin-converting enzyme 2 [Helianthus debilis subsp. tardiflorus]